MTIDSMSRPVAGGTTERRNQKYPHEQSTTDAPSCQAQILDYLGIGAENATSSNILREMLGLADIRQLRKKIAEARADGALILSGPGGYYLPADGEQGQQEAADFLRTLDAKANSMLRAGDGVRRFLRDLIPGQTTFAEGGADK